MLCRERKRSVKSDEERGGKKGRDGKREKVLGKPSTLLTLNTRGQTFCGVEQLLRSSFFVDFACKQQCILIPGENIPRLF